MRVLLVSTYELGHQPLHLAAPAAALEAAGHDVVTLDIAVEDWDPSLVDRAHAVAFSVPMHTAMRIAVRGAREVKRRRPDLPVCFYGLYATNRTADGVVDHVVAGEYESGLIAWVDGLTRGEVSSGGGIDLRRSRARLPVRTSLPPLERYARLAVDGEERAAGYVEASHGCAHRCRHCPVPVVYDGRTRKVDVDIVLDDVAQMVAQGARHITFGDPDFLNRWAHSMQVVSELHERYPDVTYDVTTKVEHILRHADLLGDLARTGCLFAVSAYECVNDEILRILDKGHTGAEASRATLLLREHGIEPRPSWLPFMPWTTVDDVGDILDFVIAHDLIGNVDPVQYTIKLLIPEGSLMLSVPELVALLGGYDEETLSYRWTAADPRTVGLQQRLASLVEDAQAAGETAGEIFRCIHAETRAAAGLPSVRLDIPDGVAAPRLTEPWFCCAEPTQDQFTGFEEIER